MGINVQESTQYQGVVEIAGSPQNTVIEPARETILAQFALPLIMPPTGSIGDNGALTLGTALNTTYAACYMYFPASAIVTGSGAGWYYVVMSSTTAGTIYNNVYSPSISDSVPSIPSSTVSFVTTGPGAYTQATTIQTAYSVLLPANSLGTNGSLEVWIDQLCNNTAGTKTITLLADTTLLHSMGLTTTLGSPHRVILQNRGHVARQKITRPNVASEAAVSSIATMFTSKDTSVDITLNIGLTLSVATDHVSLEGLIIKAQKA